MLTNNPKIVTNGIKSCWDPLMSITRGAAAPRQTTLPNECTLPSLNEHATMYNGGCIDFDGTDDEIVFGSYTPGNGSWTISMWVNADSFSYDSFLSNTSGGPVTSAFSINPATGKIRYRNYAGGAFSWQYHSGLTTLSTGQWYLCTWVNYTGLTASTPTMRMFVNGVVDSSEFGADGSAFTTNGGPINVLGRNWASTYYNGKMADVRFYNVALTDAEVYELYKDTKVILPGGVGITNLKRRWPLIEGSGVICYDGSGNESDATITNGEGYEWAREGGAPPLIEGFNRPAVFGGKYTTGTASQTSYTVTGVGTAWTSKMVGKDFNYTGGSGNAGVVEYVDSATSLGVSVSKTVSPAENYAIGGTDYVNCGTDSSLHITGDITVAAWVWWEPGSSGEHVIYCDGAYCETCGTLLQTRTSTTLRFMHNTGSLYYYFDAGVFSSGKWHHVAMTYSTASTTMTGYIDGASFATDSSGSASTGSRTNATTIGKASWTDARYWPGIINEVIVYNTPLALADIQALAATGPNGGPLPPDPMALSTSENIVSYWRNDGDTTWVDRAAAGMIDNTGTVYGTPDSVILKQGYNGSKSTSTGRDGQGFPLLNKNVGALGCNEDNYYTAIGDGNFSQIGGLGSLDAWVFMTKNKWMYFYWKGYNAANSLYLGYHSGAPDKWFFGSYYSSAYKYFYWRGVGQSTYAADFANRWHYLTMTYDKTLPSDNWKVYHNGVYADATDYTTDLGTSTHSVQVGGGGRGWDGQIGPIRLYDRVLSASEITQNFDAQRHRFGL